jgi:ferric-chelate reductase
MQDCIRRVSAPNTQTHPIRRPITRARPRHNLTSYPPHVPEWPAIARPLGGFLRFRVAPSYSLGQFLLVLGYSAVMAYSWFYKSNPFADPNRTGFVAVSQLPIIIALATKNNLVGLFLGAGYEKVCFSSNR